MRTSSIFNSQHVATRCNSVAKRVQHVAPNNVAIYCIQMLWLFGQYMQMLGQQCCDMLHSNVVIVWPVHANAGPTMLRYVAFKCCDCLASTCKCWANNVAIRCIQMLCLFGRVLQILGQQCCDMLRWDVAIIWPGLHATSTNDASKIWTFSNLSLQHLTCRNTSQHVATWWPNARHMLRPTMLRSFGRGFMMRALLF